MDGDFLKEDDEWPVQGRAFGGGQLRTFRYAICLFQRSRSIRATMGNLLNFDIES